MKPHIAQKPVLRGEVGSEATRGPTLTYPQATSAAFSAFQGAFPGLIPNPDKASYSSVLVSFRGTRFPSLLGEEPRSLSYVEHQLFGSI